MTASAICSVSCCHPRSETRERSSARLPTCLYSDGVATPARAATAARVRAAGPWSSTWPTARSTTASGDSPALGTDRLLEEAADRRGGLVGELRVHVVAGVLEH